MTPLSPILQFGAHWPAINALLDDALNLAAAERAIWLESLVGEQALHRETLRMLLAHQAEVETDDFLNVLPRLDIEVADPSIHGPAVGDSVGAYRLIEQIGQGGMGSVWLAERADRIMNRRVALKLPRIAWGEAFAERLTREREILATLEHEHIARLYDAGLDAHGRPFLAMEYIEGEPLDAYLRSHALSMRELVALLLQVMAAVSHAHSRLVVHRDLKPGNILVTADGKVKLLDFGIAKLLEGGSTLRTALTELSGRALTLDYASPEQIRGDALGTATDVYSMGVVAYESLAAARPYRLARATAAELEEAIASLEPPLASQRAPDRHVARQLRGDLDSILNKALKKAAGERYSTMEAFAQDLRRWLDGEPVKAQPDRFAYRASKFVVRHRLQVVAGSMVGVALLAGISIALWQAREAGLSAERARTETARAKVEAATAKAVQGFIESVFNANSRFQADPNAAGNATARELLDRGADRIDKELATEPEAQLRLYDVLAQMYAGMALNERGLVLYRRALGLATRLHGQASEPALVAAANIGQTLDELGQRDEALAILLKADAAAAGRAADRDAIRINIDTNLAHLYFRTDLPKGLERARRAAAIARELGPSLDGIGALSVLGDLARKSGSLNEARQALSDAVAWVDLLGAEGVLPNILGSLGDVQDELGQIEPAGVTMARAIALAEKLGDSQSLHIARYKLARYQYGNGLLREALDTAGAEAQWARAPGGEQQIQNLGALILANYGRTLVAYGDAARGLATLDEARAQLPQAPTDRLGPILASRADALVSLGRLTEAGADIERAVAASAKAGPRIVEAVRESRRRYLMAAGKASEALQDLSDNPPKPGEATAARVLLRRQAQTATLLLAAGDDGAARSAATRGLATIEQTAQRRYVRDAEARLTAVLGKALLREDRAAEALPVLQKSLALHLDQYDPVHSPAVANARFMLAEAQRSLDGANAANAQAPARRLGTRSLP